MKYFVEVNKKPKKIKQSLHYAENFNITAVKDSLNKRQKWQSIHMLHAYPKISWPQPTDSLPTSLSFGINSPSHEFSSHFTSHAPLVFFRPHSLSHVSEAREQNRIEEGNKTEEQDRGSSTFMSLSSIFLLVSTWMFVSSLNKCDFMFYIMTSFWNSWSNERSSPHLLHPTFTISCLLQTDNHKVNNQEQSRGFKVDILKSTLMLEIVSISIVIMLIIYLLNSWRKICLNGRCRITSACW